MTQDDTFDHVIKHVMPLIYDHMREDALNAGQNIHARMERFVTHDQYQLARHDLVNALTQMRADAQLTEYVLTRVLPAHRPQLH